MWTDVLQFFVFASTIIVALILLMIVGGEGFSASIDTYRSDRSNLLLDFTPSLTLKHGTWAIVIGTFLEALSAFGADQVAVQRYISAKSERTSQIGYVINLLGMWLVIPGLLLIGVGLFAYYDKHPAELLPLLEGAGSSVGELPEPSGDMHSAIVNAGVQDQVFPEFARTHFPPGMVGLFLVALMAAVMSSIDSGIHSVTTAIIVDFRDRLKPEWTPEESHEDVNLIRGLLVVVGSISVALACFVGPLGDVFDIAKKLTAAFGGPLLAVFIMAFFSKLKNSVAILIGTIVAAGGTLVLMYQFDQWFSMWFWPIGFSLTLILCFLLALVFPKPQPDNNEPLTFWNVMRRDAADSQQRKAFEDA
ncbi:MAG: hypothetical protein R3C05_19315 [Pirellulaceae bacterium]